MCIFSEPKVPSDIDLQNCVRYFTIFARIYSLHNKYINIILDFIYFVAVFVGGC